MTASQVFAGVNNTTAKGGEGRFAALPEPVFRWDHDPLDPDAVDDELVVTTTRRMMRVAVAAADVGARFTREGIHHDPVSWMIAPRTLFGGRAAMDACQDLPCFNRSIVLHGLGLGLDAEPADVDDLLGEEDGPLDIGVEGHAEPGSDREPRLPRPRLLSCWVDSREGGRRLFAFCALVTDRPADLLERVIGRYGAVAAAEARFSAGFDHSTALATAMISDAMADTLALAATDPESPLALRLDVVVEQRFAA